MAKDPAFLFYYQDFLVGTSFLSNDSIGAYIKILCHQADKGHLNKNVIIGICGSEQLFETIEDKFKIDDNGMFYNKRLEIESKKRKEYTESRRKNRNKGDNKNLHIYVLKNPVTNLIKIGSSVNPKRRIIELSNQENIDLELVCYSKKTSQNKESELHTFYKSSRKQGEWFDIDPNHIINHMTNHMSLTMVYTYDQSYDQSYGK